MTRYESKLAKSFSRAEPQKLGFSAVAGCFLVSLLYFTFFDPYMDLSSILKLPSSIVSSPATYLATANATILQKSEALQESKLKVLDASHNIVIANSSSTMSNLPSQRYERPAGGQKETIRNLNSSFDRKHDSCTSDCGHTAGIQTNNSTTATEAKNSTNSLQLLIGGQNDTYKTRPVCDGSKSNGSCTSQVDGDHHGDLRNSSAAEFAKAKGNEKDMRSEKPLCDVSNKRADVCDMEGDVRIHGMSSSVLAVSPNYANESSWIIRPYARKGDDSAMENVRKVQVKSSMHLEDSPTCDINHTVPAIVFSDKGYTGNFFHDFTDVIIPLFLTSRQYNGEVKFLVTHMNRWWINKYKVIFDHLTNYDLIDFDRDDKTRCFRRAIVGLRYHRELTIIPTMTPVGYSMLNFTKFMRTTYSLKRDTAIKIKPNTGKKPRLLVISRKRTRKFLNLKEIVHLAKSLGFFVIIGESTGDVARFASIVNTCDVILGVHGAGLTNIVYLPVNAVLIQIIPFGNLQWLSRFDFGQPAVNMGLKYLEYNIRVEESSLISKYPRDHDVIKNPSSIGKKGGWDAFSRVYLQEQDVTVDVNRFRGVLLEALKLLHA